MTFITGTFEDLAQIKDSRSLKKAKKITRFWQGCKDSQIWSLFESDNVR